MEVTRGTPLSPRRSPRPGGFSLVELMVTLFVALIVLMGVYLLYQSSVRGYRVQNQIIDAHGQLRMAVSQLKTHLGSAGFNAPAQSLNEPWVRVPGGQILSAVAIEPDPGAPVAQPASNLNIAPMRLRLLGDFTAHRTYTTVFISATQVRILWDSTVQGDEAEFYRVFDNTHMLRVEIHGAARMEQFIAIVSSDYNGGVTPLITLASPVEGVGGFGEGHEVSVLSYVRYRLVADTRRNAASQKIDLVQERLDPAGVPLVGTMLIVAEYVTDFQFYDLCINGTAPEPGTGAQEPIQITCFPTLVDLGNAGLSLQADATNDAHLLRSVTLKVAVRTPFEDEDVPFAPRTSVDLPLKSYELDPNVDGAARVYEMASRVFLTSIQARRQ